MDIRWKIGVILITSIISVLSFEILLSSTEDSAQSQAVYVPVYSSIFFGDMGREFHLAVTVSIRNTDMKNTMTVEVVDYYDTSGKLLHHYLTKERTLNPLESIHYLVKESDLAGGIGANIIVRWRSSATVNAPVIESVMIGTSGQQGISFISRGVATH